MANARPAMRADPGGPIAAAYRSRHEVTLRRHRRSRQRAALGDGPHDIAIDQSVRSSSGGPGCPSHFIVAGVCRDPRAFRPFLFDSSSRSGPPSCRVRGAVLWPVVRALLRESRLDGVRVVHPRNFETDHQRDLASIKGPVEEYFLKYVAATEREIAAVSIRGDGVGWRRRELSRDWGGERRGRAQRVPAGRTDPGCAARVNAYFGEQPFTRFLSSAHLPNVQDCWISPAFPPRASCRFVICGSVCNPLTEHRAPAR